MCSQRKSTRGGVSNTASSVDEANNFKVYKLSNIKATFRPVDDTRFLQDAVGVYVSEILEGGVDAYSSVFLNTLTDNVPQSDE